MRADIGRCARAVILSLCAYGLCGCAEIPPDSYGIRRLRLLGLEEMDSQALRACLATEERDHFGINLGTSAELSCGDPPFDGGRLHWRLWSWGWTDWPVLDLAVFERDLDRIERWFRARGFYDARVLSTRLEPSEATTSDRLDANDESPSCERVDEDEGCEVEITIRVEEGEPVIIDSIALDIATELEGTSERRIRQAFRIEEGGRWDEALYDRSKARMVATLREAGYACAEVTGTAEVDPEARRARVAFTVTPGPRSSFGDVTLDVSGEGADRIPRGTVMATVDIDEGDRYAPSEIASAQRAVYALGSFSSVTVEGTPRRAEDGACEGVVDVAVSVTPGRRVRYGVGAGLQSGYLADIEQGDVPQWDVHLLFFWEHRNFLGGLRRLRIEERPKVVFKDLFPDPTDPGPGNELKLEFRQPAFLEARTTLITTARWDLGPDPNQPSIFRHDIDAAIGLSRPFLGGRLLISTYLRQNFYERLQRFSDEEARAITSDYYIIFFDHYLQLDLRDDGRQPTKGLFLQVGLHEGGLLEATSWDYVRLTPEVRGYAPLGLGFVLAARFGMGAMFILNADEDLDDISERLGPTRYRLRGGGPTSHRGFVAGTMGDVGEVVPGSMPQLSYNTRAGGLRRWEASLELRMPVSEDFGLVTFADLGDVNRETSFRFRYLHLALGLGFRYQTIVGPLRLDFGFLIPGAQRIGGEEPPPRNAIHIGRLQIPGAISLTFGEAF